MPSPQVDYPTLTTSLDPLPQEIRSRILDAYILSTPLSSHSYQDILYLDHQTHNRAVVRLYDKTEEEERWVEKTEALLKGTADYSHSRTARYPKYFLIRRVRQITFRDPTALAHTGKATRFFTDPITHVLEHLWQGDQPWSAQYLFQPATNSTRNFGLIFPPSFMESVAWKDQHWEPQYTLSELGDAFPGKPDLCGGFYLSGSPLGSQSTA
ncbi:hypothetical protein IAT38_005463 [Cryptococcus sp. DSM 104549]